MIVFYHLYDLSIGGDGRPIFQLEPDRVKEEGPYHPDPRRAAGTGSGSRLYSVAALAKITSIEDALNANAMRTATITSSAARWPSRQLMLFGNFRSRLLNTRIDRARFYVELCKITQNLGFVSDCHSPDVEGAKASFRQH